ncbi:hypothetical protein SAMN05428988_0131 [Chitinophaga sp. YR573]|uniref:hypothetical protein n=1 Tax=Chitinophaga sp. YR573 TaxID=1881040 RepID=UPI0008CEE6B6|nr:hypothetical protein [Chitinophaga sp. YR573]SEV88673.1 hypothetical protein SAMN05428988_0131 [Chitinophaga sp. YR573]
MSDYKPETLPSGVLMRKIKDDDNRFILSDQGQALIVTNIDIASMYGLAYKEEPIDAERAWHDVSQKFLESELEKRLANNCIACTIQERDEQVKQMPAHTCGIDGPTDKSAETNSYDSEVRRIAEILAMIEYKKCKWVLMTWDQLTEATINPDYDFVGIDYYMAKKQELIDCKMEEAHVMIAEINTAHYKGYVTGLSAKDQFPLDDEISIVSRSQYYLATLIKRGLIPSSANK